MYLSANKWPGRGRYFGCMSADAAVVAADDDNDDDGADDAVNQ